ncbi:MAG: ABC transporter ATP-binding protein [Planctomycetes bacterium]|nr:ABC transporter ATP-binding protein [Planctomycetota bacterium]
MKDPVLRISNLQKSYGGRRVLDGVQFDVSAGEFTVVLGPTGAGKTTLLRTIAGLETPDAGNIIMNGADALSLPPAARDVALVFQNFSLYPGKTVRANLEFPLRAPERGLGESDIKDRVAKAASMLHIERLLDRPARQLSGGEMQRVAIGRAIVRRPSLFLMDEPLTNLDAKLREELRVELRELARGLGAPVLWVTHDPSEALSMADRIIVLIAGRILQIGAPENVYFAPASPEVARQLGSPPINLISAVASGDLWRCADGTPICNIKHPAPASALLGIRPEHIAPTGGESPATVEVVENMGPTRVVVARFGSVVLHLLTSRDFSARPGDIIFPRVDGGKIIVWSA